MKIKLNFLENIFMMSLFSQTIVFSFFSIIGRSIGGLNYRIIQLLIVGLEILAIGICLNKHGAKIRGNSNLLVPFILVAAFLVNINKSESSWTFFEYFIIWGFIPTLFFVSFKKTEINTFIPKLEAVFFFQSIAAFLAVIRYYRSGYTNLNYMSFGGETYQTVSYTAATSFGMALFFGTIYKSKKRMKFFSNRIWNYIMWPYIILCAITSFLAGGRGGALLVIEYIVLFIFAYGKSKDKSINKKLVIYLLFFISLAILLFLSNHNDYLIRTLRRSFSYLTGNGIDFSKTSYRDIIYVGAFNYWKEKPFFGHGLFNYLNNGYPHNFFLDLMETGGIVFLIFGLYYLFRIIRKIVTSFNKGEDDLFFGILSISILTMLMFSGTFYSHPGFWFCFVYYLVI